MLGCCAPAGRPGAAPSGWRPVKNGTPISLYPLPQRGFCGFFTLAQTGLWDEEPNAKNPLKRAAARYGVGWVFWDSPASWPEATTDGNVKKRNPSSDWQIGLHLEVSTCTMR